MAMIKKITGFIKDILTPHTFGLMVVNCSYYRPMVSKLDNLELRYMSDDKYLEICGQIRHK